MVKVIYTGMVKMLSALLAASILLAISGCIKQTSEDADVLNDAGTSSGAAIVVDPDKQ